MTFQLFNRRMLIASLLLFSFLVMACADKSRSGEKVVPTGRELGIQGPPTAAENRNASSNEFEGTAGSLSYKGREGQPLLLREIRAAEQSGFDRVVFEFDGPEIPGYNVGYVEKPYECGSGDVAKVAGTGWLEIRFNPAVAYTQDGQPTIADDERRLSLPILKAFKRTCDFEADVTVVLGVSSPNRYRVLNLTNPARVVIDIKHQNR